MAESGMTDDDWRHAFLELDAEEATDVALRLRKKCKALLRVREEETDELLTALIDRLALMPRQVERLKWLLKKEAMPRLKRRLAKWDADPLNAPDPDAAECAIVLAAGQSFGDKIRAVDTCARCGGDDSKCPNLTTKPKTPQI